MKTRMLRSALLLFAAFLFHIDAIQAQSPGLIVQPRNGGVVTFLNPNTDNFTSKTSDGFLSNDVTESEISFKIIPRAEPEPMGDNNGGKDDGATDFVQGADGSGFYAFYDGTNVIFRFRVGGKSNGARGFSVLLDTDLKIGNTGFYADPNYVPQSKPRSGNPGFELEILYAQGKGVKIFNVDGKVVGTEVASYPENTHSQISIALSKTDNNADYFVDFGVPASALGLGTQYIRMVGTTCNSANSALNNNASDVWGINDIDRKNLIPNWTKLINMQCGIGISDLSADGPGLCICTPAPFVNAPIPPGTNVSVTGTWNRLSSLYSSQTTLTLYKNNTAVSTITATTGVPWSITVPSLVIGDTLYATAQSLPENMCGTSNKVPVSCTGQAPQANILCASLRGMEGRIPLGATVDIYELTPGNINPYTTKMTTGLVYTDSSTFRTFNYYGTNPQSGSACSYSKQQFTYTNYMVIVNQGGCESQPLFMCLSSTGWNTLSLHKTLQLSGPIYAGQTSVSGTGGSNKQDYRLFVNGKYVTFTTGQLGGGFTFNGLNLAMGDTLVVYEQVNNTSCITYSPTYTVQCTQPTAPTITSNGGEILSSASSIGGYGTLSGATVTLYKGVAPSGTAVGSSVVNSGGEWLVSGLTLTKDETYYAVQTTNGCTTPASTSVTVVPVTTVCPSISGSYTESAAAINGTLPSPFTGKIRLYKDGAFVKSVDVTNVSSWSIPVNTDLTNFTDKLSPSDSLAVTSETPDGGETDMCSYIIVNCDMPPAPVANPTSVTVSQGQAATFTLASSSNEVLYSVLDQSDNTNGTSVFGNGGAISLITKAFGTPGTYDLKVAADNLAAPQCRQIQNVTVTVNAVTLPVHFVSATLKADHNGSRIISWSVSGEEGTTLYLVERSLDCNRFEPIATVPVQGSSAGIGSYSRTDAAHLKEGKVCYRIQAVNMNGSSYYSRVMSLRENKSLSLLLVPNPAENETTLYLTSDRQQLVTVEIADAMGRIVIQRKIQVSEGRNLVTLSELSHYSKGHYIVQVRTSTDTQYLKLIIK